MIHSSPSKLPNVNYSMKPDELLSETSLDLFCEHNAEKFALDIEEKAAALEVTCDYYMMEFM
jgi:hypothetical protein